METFHGIYEDGIVRFPGPVALPNYTPVTVVAQTESVTPAGCNSPELYALLSERYNSGHTDTAARHNEHQP